MFVYQMMGGREVEDVKHYLCGGWMLRSFIWQRGWRGTLIQLLTGKRPHSSKLETFAYENSFWELIRQAVTVYTPAKSDAFVFFQPSLQVIVYLQGCLTCKLCSAYSLNCRHLSPHIKLKLLELPIKLRIPPNILR